MGGTPSSPDGGYLPPAGRMRYPYQEGWDIITPHPVSDLAGVPPGGEQTDIYKYKYYLQSFAGGNKTEGKGFINNRDKLKKQTNSPTSYMHSRIKNIT